MARILYGVHGTGHGHAMRGLTIARAMPQHEFLFIANDDAPGVLEPEFQVRRIPNLGTVFKNYKVDFGATIKRAVPLLLHARSHIKQVLQIMDEFKPDVCMVDLEYFVPRAAKLAGLPCMTLDHQHILTCCRHKLPPDLWWDAFAQGLTPRYLFKPTAFNLLVSFYAPPMSPRYRGIVAAPILREAILKAEPREGEHILVYQSNSSDRRLIDFLKTATSRKCYVFGYPKASGQDGNVFFRPKSEAEFIDLLACCAYVIQGGSHTLMSEALYLQKPILSLPLKAMVEQRLNAYYLQKLGYGLQTGMANLGKRLLNQFERELPDFRGRIKKGDFCGNRLVFTMVDRYARSGQYPILEDD